MRLKKQLLKLRGGVYPQYNKHLTSDKPIEICKASETIVIPMQQHLGVPCKPLVSVGDKVALGQRIGEPAGYVSAPIHSSVSGIVKEIGFMPHPIFGESLAVKIANDFEDSVCEIDKPKSLDELTPEEIKALVLSSGIVGLGGATFPTHVKLSPPHGKIIDTFVLNGTECEPYLTSDNRIMIEKPEAILTGMRAMMKSLGVSTGLVVIEDNKPEAIVAMNRAASRFSGIEVMPLKTVYSQGAEKQIIKTALGREVPSGKLPMDVGVVLNNVATALSVANVLSTGIPLIERVITVSGGGIVTPKNLLVRIGTSYECCIEKCGGLKSKPYKIISGGPMMGMSQSSLLTPVIKGTTGIIVFEDGENCYPKESNCIRCATCFKVCPVSLMPMMIHAHAFKGNFAATKSYRPLDCIECGCCSYACPSKIPLLQSISVAKRKLTAKP